MNSRIAMITTLAVISVILVQVPAAAQQNPFTGSGRAQETTPDSEFAPGTDSASPATVTGYPGETRSIFPVWNSWLRNRQRELNARIASLIRSYQDTTPETDRTGETGSAGIEGAADTSGPVIPLIGLMAFIYGLVHAALPGHRKVLLVSYFVATDAPVAQAVIAGLSVAALHSGAAIAVVLSSYYLLQTSLSIALENTTAYLQGITALGILVVGGFVLVSKLREAIRMRSGRGDHEQESVAGHPTAVRRMQNRIGLLPAIVLSAVVPCPGSAMILLFAISLGVVSLGLYAVLFFSLGMAITLSSVLVLAVLTKRAVLGALDGPAGVTLHLAIEGFSGVVMVVVGVVLLLPLL